MIFQEAVMRESRRAQMAREWLLHRVPLAVTLEHCCLCESLAALWAVEHLHSTCVQPLVSVQRYLCTELGWAHGTGVPFLTRVPLLVLNEIQLESERPATKRASKRLLARMQCPVLNEMHLLSERLATLEASVGPFACVHSLVSNEMLPTTKLPATGEAGMGPLAHVQVSMRSRQALARKTALFPAAFTPLESFR